MEIRPPTTRWHSATACKSSQGICTDVFTSADVGDVTDVKVLTKRLRLVVERQQIRLPDFIFVIHLVDDQLRIPNASSMVMLDSRASSNLIIKAWYSAALFEHDSNSENACGIMYLLGLTKRMPIPDISFPFSFVLVAPSKYIFQEAFGEEVSML
ncbi:hypothetical protein AAC387_Pa03g1721 [Persea americana]